jgi:RNA 2',3'-cyclic 3'-phosphodiesterase
MSERLRLFMAITLPEELKKRIGALQRELRPFLQGARWVRPEGLHITLKFLGAVEAARLPDIGRAAATVARAHRRFDLVVDQVAGAPRLARPRVVWLSCKAAHQVDPPTHDPLATVYAELEAAFAALGFGVEKRAFRPHVTLARCKLARVLPDLPPREIVGALAGERIPVTEFTLFESRLKPSGAVYEPRERFSLQNG